jgi:hypothetical protein
VELSLAFIGWFFALTSAGALVLGAALIAMLANAGDLQRRYLSYSIVTLRSPEAMKAFS